MTAAQRWCAIYANPTHGGWTSPRQTPGHYSFDFALTGPQGPGEGSVSCTVLGQPGPPLLLSWAIGSLPLIGLIVFLALAWRRLAPGRHSLRT